jgi:hypothetical protein
MSIINSVVERRDREEEAESKEAWGNEEDEGVFLSICQRFEEKLVRVGESHKRMDMVYNYMVKNDIKTERKTDQK